jgi:hypothetical protein
MTLIVIVIVADLAFQAWLISSTFNVAIRQAGVNTQTGFCTTERLNTG